MVTPDDFFRINYVNVADANKAKIKAIKEKAYELLALYDEHGHSRYHSLARTDLESSVMWIVKEITAEENNQ